MNPEFAEAVARLTEYVQAALATGGLVFLRVGAAMAFVPAFGEQVVPVRVRLVITLAFAVVLTPAMADRIAPMSHSLESFLAAALPEVIAGLVLGAGVRLFVIALQIAGTMAAQSTSLAQFFGGHGVDPQPALSQLMLMGGLALAAITGLHVRLVEAFLISYEVMPPGRLPGAGDVAQWGVAQVSRAFSMAFTFAAPFLIAALLYNASLGVINRAMPQLMVVLIGAPAKVGGGLLMMLFVLPIAMRVWIDAFNSFLAAPFTGGP